MIIETLEDVFNKDEDKFRSKYYRIYGLIFLIDTVILLLKKLGDLIAIVKQIF